MSEIKTVSIRYLASDLYTTKLKMNTDGAWPLLPEAQLPPAIPYAMWLSLLDGSTMAMLEQRDGPKWTFDLEPWAVRIYVIDKILK